MKITREMTKRIKTKMRTKKTEMAKMMEKKSKKKRKKKVKERKSKPRIIKFEASSKNTPVPACGGAAKWRISAACSPSLRCAPANVTA